MSQYEIYTLTEVSISGMHRKLTPATGSRSVPMKVPGETRKRALRPVLYHYRPHRKVIVQHDDEVEPSAEQSNVFKAIMCPVR